MPKSLFARFLAGEADANGIRGEVPQVREDNALSDDSAESRLSILPHKVGVADK